ncbi:hypothetical protein D3C86_1265380 [compost metagenome]
MTIEREGEGFERLAARRGVPFGAARFKFASEVLRVGLDPVAERPGRLAQGGASLGTGLGELFEGFLQVEVGFGQLDGNALPCVGLDPMPVEHVAKAQERVAQHAVGRVGALHLVAGGLALGFGTSHEAIRVEATRKGVIARFEVGAIEGEALGEVEDGEVVG